MRKIVFLFLTLMSIYACSSSRKMGAGTYGSPYVKQKLLNEYTFVVNGYAVDKTYGYTEKNPVMVGSDGGGPSNERRFLNALTGPNGEELKYFRIGSCCGFKTKNGLYGDGGLLDMYDVRYEGLKESLVIYINMYDSDTLKVPVGLTIKN